MRFEDEHLLVVTKPAGVNTHRADPVGQDGMHEWVQRQRPGTSLSILHRLDKATSGLLVFGKTAEANQALTVGLGTGLKALDLSAFGDSWEVSLGAVATYAIDPATTVGASWIFGKVVAGYDNPPDPAPAVKGLDFRGVQVWGAKTF